MVERENVVADKPFAVVLHMRRASRLTHDSFPSPQYSWLSLWPCVTMAATAFGSTSGNRLQSRH